MASPAAMLTVEIENGQIIFGNPAAASMFNAKNEADLLALDPGKLSPETQPDGRNSRAGLMEMIKVATQTGRCSFEWTYRRLTGEEFFADVLLSQIELNGIIHVNAIITDISVRKNIETKLIDSERRLKKAQLMAQVGNWELDVQSNKIWASEQAYRIYGTDPTVSELTLGDVQKYVLSEFRPYLNQALDALIKSGAEYNVEFKIRRKNDGAIRSIHSKAEVYKDSFGNTVKVLGVIQDITDLKVVEASAQESQLMLQNIIDLLPVRIFWKDNNLRYLGCNKAFAQDAGKNSPSELIGKDDFDMGWKDQAELYREDDKNVISTGVSKINYEEPQTTPEGKKIWLITNKVPLTSNTEEIKGVLGTYLNITDLKLAEDELKTKNKELELLNSSMIDRELKMVELKNKLNKLKGSSE